MIKFWPTSVSFSHLQKFVNYWWDANATNLYQVKINVISSKVLKGD